MVDNGCVSRTGIMNKRSDMNKKNSTENISGQRRKRAVRMKRALVLFLAAAFLMSMPLSMYMVSAGEGGDLAVASGDMTGDQNIAGESQPAAVESVPEATGEPEPASVPEQVSEPEPAPAPAVEPEAATEPAAEPAANPAPVVEPEIVPAPATDPQGISDAKTMANPLTASEPAAQGGQSEEYTVNWLNDDGIKIIGTSKFKKEIDPGTVSEKYPNGTPAKEDDDTYYYTFSGWTNGRWTDETQTVYTFTAQYTPNQKTTVIWLNGDGKELERKTFIPGDSEPGPDRAATKAPTSNCIYTFTGWDEGLRDDANYTITYSPLFTAEFTLFLDEQKTETLVISAERIPGNAELKLKEKNTPEELKEYLEAVKEALNVETGIAKNRSEDTAVFTLDFSDLAAQNGGLVFNEEHSVTIKGQILKELPANALLYRLYYENGQRPIKAEKIEKYEPEKNETASAESKLKFQAKEFCAFVLAVPGEHVHKLTAHPEVKASCTAEGTQAHWECEECGKLFSDSKGNTEIQNVVLPKTSHVSHAETTTVPATCEKEGSETTVTTCSVCGQELDRKVKTLPALKHDWDNGVITKQPTCVTPGEKVFTCKRDKTHKKTEQIPATNKHTPAAAVEENRVDAKAGQPGSYDKVVYCATCGEELSREKVTIPALPTPEPNAMTAVGTITVNKDGETGMVSATAENAPENAYLSIGSVDPSVIELVESSRIKNKTTGQSEAYDVWFAVDINLGVTPSSNVTITLQSQKLASLPDGALLYHVNPQTNRVRKTAYTYSKAEGKLSFKSKDFSPFVILVKHGTGNAAKDIKDAAANNNLEGGSGVPTYYPAGDNGSGFSGYNGTGAYMGTGFNDTSVLGGMNNTNVTGVNGTDVMGANKTDVAGENNTNTTKVAGAANVTDEGNATSSENKTSVKEKDSGSSGGGMSTGVVIGIIAAIAAAVAVIFGITRYMKNGRNKEE